MYFDAPRAWDNLPLRLSTEEIANPFEIIHSFFSAHEKCRCSLILERWLQSVCENKKCKESPSSLLFFYDRLSELIEAAFLISQLDNTRRKSVLLAESEKEDFCIMAPTLYCAWSSSKFAENKSNLLWMDFPRNLNRREFISPYHVFKKMFKFYKLGQWRHELHYLFNIALSKEGLLDDAFDTDILSVRKHLHKLIDAAHLIDIREFRLEYITSINGGENEEIDK
ncbi:hypothetical protein ACDQ55_11590 [Chitinophaga sp. 30R24]|uniref:hypothetical protein n=1 Tax=Chitinophaga sp. 30R24 TaxID=3248838 RepID=UPI003B9096B6